MHQDGSAQSKKTGGKVCHQVICVGVWRRTAPTQILSRIFIFTRIHFTHCNLICFIASLRVSRVSSCGPARSPHFCVKGSDRDTTMLANTFIAWIVFACVQACTEVSGRSVVCVTVICTQTRGQHWRGVFAMIDAPHDGEVGYLHAARREPCANTRNRNWFIDSPTTHEHTHADTCECITSSWAVHTMSEPLVMRVRIWFVACGSSQRRIIAFSSRLGRLRQMRAERRRQLWNSCIGSRGFNSHEMTNVYVRLYYCEHANTMS